MAGVEIEREPTLSQYRERYHHWLEIKKLFAERLQILQALLKDKEELLGVYRERANRFHGHSLDDQARLLRFSCYVHEVLGKEVDLLDVDKWWSAQGLRVFHSNEERGCIS